ncbi:hypothetical protein GCM10007170_40710 [Arthrobacter liuii]|uniref:Uncharacterized protein n=1 Tax=Arthrobacter liuii TaxID=1476996 RepID=A0ABQ2B0N2_9MICC|nr:hypothetical protein GCM10007170_40710 [Arthrobacter liuii]
MLGVPAPLPPVFVQCDRHDSGTLGSNLICTCRVEYPTSGPLVRSNRQPAYDHRRRRPHGLSLKEIFCVLNALSVPDSVVTQMDATRALDGMQRASWDKISATWTYHPNTRFRVILTESK